MKPKTIQEVSAQIRSAGLKSEDSAGKEEAIAPPKEEGKEELGEAKGQERPDNGCDGESVIEPPAPGPKSEADLEKDPNVFLDPAPVETRPEDDVEPGTEPNTETEEKLDGDKNEAPENKINEDVVGEMGGGTLNDALKKTFGDFLEKAKMSRLGKSTYKGIEYEISKRGKNADNNTPWEVWVEGQKIKGFWYSASDAGKAAREYIDESFSENDMKKMSKLADSTDRVIYRGKYEEVDYEVQIKNQQFYGYVPSLHGKLIGPFDNIQKAKKAAEDMIDDLSGLSKLSRLSDEFKPGDKVVVTETSKFTFGEIKEGEKGTVVEVYSHAAVKGFVKVKIGDKTPVFPPRAISKLTRLADDKGVLSFNDHPANNTKVSDKEYVAFLKMAISKLEEAISKASFGGPKAQMQKELKHWKSELKYMEDTGQKMSRFARVHKVVPPGKGLHISNNGPEGCEVTVEGTKAELDSGKLLQLAEAEAKKYFKKVKLDRKQSGQFDDDSYELWTRWIEWS